MPSPQIYLIFAAFICAAALSTKGRYKWFMEVLGRNMLAVFLVGIGMFTVFVPSPSLFVFVWLGFNLLSTITKGVVQTTSLICELIFLVYWCIPVY